MKQKSRKYISIPPLTVVVTALTTLLLIIVVLIQLGYALSRKDVAGFQVRKGSLALDNNYTGIILRSETVVTTGSSGYITYFSRQGEHVGYGDNIYALDESGTLQNLIASANTTESILSDEELTDLRIDIANFSHNFDPEDYRDAYDFSYDINGKALRLANKNVLQNLDAVNGGYNIDMIKAFSTTTPGYVTYSIDGYENKTAEMLTEEDFNRDNYTETMLENNALVDQQSPIYKLITSETWSVVIPLDEYRLERLRLIKEVSSMKNPMVKFLKNQQAIRVSSFDIFNIGDDYYAELRFNNSMVNFCTDRFIDIQFVDTATEGFKIPNSSIVVKEFYVIPEECVIREGEQSDTVVVLKKTFLEDGSTEPVEYEIEVYSRDEDGNYYVDNTQLHAGDYLLLQDTLEEVIVAKKGQLTGVYNINKGYARFNQVEILYSNEEYSIVDSKTRYGLLEYDFIALNADSIAEDDLIFEQYENPLDQTQDTN